MGSVLTQDDNVHLDRKGRQNSMLYMRHRHLFDCPVYSSIQASMPVLFGHVCSRPAVGPPGANACGGFVGSCFPLRSNILTS